MIGHRQRLTPGLPTLFPDQRTPARQRPVSSRISAAMFRSVPSPKRLQEQCRGILRPAEKQAPSTLSRFRARAAIGTLRGRGRRFVDDPLEAAAYVTAFVECGAVNEAPDGVAPHQVHPCSAMRSVPVSQPASDPASDEGRRSGNQNLHGGWLASGTTPSAHFPIGDTVRPQAR